MLLFRNIDTSYNFDVMKKQLPPLKATRISVSSLGKYRIVPDCSIGSAVLYLSETLLQLVREGVFNDTVRSSDRVRLNSVSASCVAYSKSHTRLLLHDKEIVVVGDGTE